MKKFAETWLIESRGVSFGRALEAFLVYSSVANISDRLIWSEKGLRSSSLGSGAAKSALGDHFARRWIGGWLAKRESNKANQRAHDSNQNTREPFY